MIDRRRRKRILPKTLGADKGDHTKEFVADLTDFGVEYADRVRSDHALFVDAFREGRIGGVSAT